MSEQHLNVITLPIMSPFDEWASLENRRENELDARLASLYAQMTEETDGLKSEIEALKAEIAELTITVNALQGVLWHE